MRGKDMGETTESLITVNITDLVEAQVVDTVGVLRDTATEIWTEKEKGRDIIERKRKRGITGRDMRKRKG